MSDLNAVAELKIAIGDYWDIAQAEAMDQRDHDDEAGSAQAKWSEIERLIDRQANQRAALLEALKLAESRFRRLSEIDCGCRPCRGSCSTGRGAEIELEGRMEAAAEYASEASAAIALAQGDAA